jgi:hypothetical protein
MNKVYTFFNYNWFKLIKKNIKNNKIIKLEKKEKEEISNLLFKKEICGIVFVLINFLITYVSSKEIYKITYKSFILFRILKDNFLTSIFWFVLLTMLPFITLIMIRKKVKSKHFILISLAYLISNLFNTLMSIYFITAFINTKILGILGLINIVITILINSNIIIKINENYLK